VPSADYLGDVVLIVFERRVRVCVEGSDITGFGVRRDELFFF
jgi:hypothetical protein